MSIDPIHKVLFPSSRPLDAVFKPKSIAIIGATDRPESVGRTVLQNVLHGGFKGKIYPVNPKYEKLLNLPCFPSVEKIDGPVDLAIVVTPAKTVPAIIEECVKKQIKGAIIISAGFKEMGVDGAKLEKEILTSAKKGNMRIIGPNCLGIMNPHFGLNGTFAAKMALKGNLAFISQSGALCTAMLDWSFKEKIGFSSFVSIGSMADVNWGDLIDYLGEDENTDAILMYMETIGNPRAFLSAARKVSQRKPIIVIKAGRTKEAAKAAISHTGSLAGSDEVFEAAMQRVGVLRIENISELFNVAIALAKQPKPKGPNFTIITNAGGPAVIATDALTSNGGEITKLEGQTLADLNTLLPEAWSHGNPVDILGDASPELYQKTLSIIAKDPSTHGILMILTPQDMTDPTETAKKIIESAKEVDKPLFASWMGGTEVSPGRDLLNQSPISQFDYPDEASQTFALMWQHQSNLNELYKVPRLLEERKEETYQEYLIVDSIIAKVLKEKRQILTEIESKLILDESNIPIVETHFAGSKEEALIIAKKIGFPVVLKVYSKTITHKADVGGVKLLLKTDEEVLQAFDCIKNSVEKKCGQEAFSGVSVQKMILSKGYEVILGSSVDEQFGPIILFGLGGSLVEIFRDNAIELPPLNPTLIQRFMKNTKIYKALEDNPQINMQALQDIIIRFSKLISQHPRIKECDINPILVSEENIIALDARFVLHDANIPDEELPKLTIRPYPIQQITSFCLANGETFTLRPINTEDEPRLIRFHERLSNESVRHRFLKEFPLNKRTSHERLAQFCYIDYDRYIILVAESEKGEIEAIASLNRLVSQDEAVFKIIVSTPYQNQGLGKNLFLHLLHIGKLEGIKKVYGQLFTNNAHMLHLCTTLGFSQKTIGEYNIVSKDL